MVGTAQSTNSGSDLDILVRFAPDARWSLLDLVRVEEELVGIFGRPVDLVTRRSVEQSLKWIRREAILGAVEPVYAGL